MDINQTSYTTKFDNINDLEIIGTDYDYTYVRTTEVYKFDGVYGIIQVVNFVNTYNSYYTDFPVIEVLGGIIEEGFDGKLEFKVKLRKDYSDNYSTNRYSCASYQDEEGYTARDSIPAAQRCIEDKLVKDILQDTGKDPSDDLSDEEYLIVAEQAEKQFNEKLLECIKQSIQVLIIPSAINIHNNIIYDTSCENKVSITFNMRQLVLIAVLMIAFYSQNQDTKYLVNIIFGLALILIHNIQIYKDSE